MRVGSFRLLAALTCTAVAAANADAAGHTSVDAVTLQSFAADALSAAGLPSFVPLGCNSGLHLCGTSVGETPLSSLVAASPSAEAIVPCGTCAVVDYTDGRAVTIPGGINVIGSLRFPSDANVTLRTAHVFVQGLLTVDPPDLGNRVGFRLYEPGGGGGDGRLMKTHHDNEGLCGGGCNMGRMPFAVAGGRLDIRGLRDPSCLSHVPLLDLDDTRTILTVGADAAACWWEGPTSAGDRIYITSPERKMKYAHTAELAGADIQNGKLVVSEPLPERFKHATKKATELFFSRVAAVERLVFLDAEEEEADGDVDGEEDKMLIGGHAIVFFTPGVAQKIEGMKITNFGQQGNLGRYPLHFHLCRDVDGSVLSKNVIYDSNQRCAVVHGSHNVTLYDNVALHSFGHCYVTEDGFEQDNVFERNLGAGMEKPTRKLFASDGVDSDERGPSVFWIMSPANHWIKNVAAGSVHAGFWFETNLAGVRAPSNLLPESKGFIPSHQPVKTFRDNVAHSNNEFGIQYYQPGWKPRGPESVIEGSIVYRNDICHLVHGNGNFVIKGGICADHEAAVPAFQNYGFRIDGLTIYGYTQNYLDVLDYSNTFFECKRDPTRGVVGITMHPFATYGTYGAQGHFSNVVFRGFDEGCPAAVPIGMSMTLAWHSVDFSPRSFTHTKFEGLGATTDRISVCRAMNRLTGVVVHDRDGTIGPMSLSGAPGFIVSNEPKITSFANGDGCLQDEAEGLGCMVYCPNACLRMILVMVSNTYSMRNITMIISDGKVEEEATFARLSPVRNPHNARSRGAYGAPLPAGNFQLSFVDKLSGQPAWPKLAELKFQKPPDCAGYADETHVTLVKPSFDADRCAQLVEDGSVDHLPDPWGEMGQWQTEWNYVMELKLVEPGYGGSGKAIKALRKEGEWCTNGFCTLAQWLDASCFAPWVRYEFSARVRVVDLEGNDSWCEDDDDNYCAVAWLDFRYHAHMVGRITEDGPDQDGWYRMSGQYVTDDTFEIPDKVNLKWDYSKFQNIEYIVDEVSLTATKFDPTAGPSSVPSRSSPPSISHHPTFVAENLAIGKPTSQSSTNNGRESGYAVDGNDKTFTFTKNGQNWWQVDLESPSIITKIKIYQAKESYNKKLLIDIRDSNGNSIEERTWGGDDTLERKEFNYGPQGVVGQIVFIKNVEFGYLSLSEVEVYGKYTAPPSPAPTLSAPPTYLVRNLSYRKPTWQSSTLNDRSSDFAVDGNKDTYTYTKRGYNAWEVDLKSPAIITKVKITQRWPEDKLWIDIKDSNDKIVERKDWDVEGAPNEFEFDFDEVVGQKVRISERINWYLSLSEVEVHGKYLVEPPTPSLTVAPTVPSTLVPSTGPSLMPSISSVPSLSSRPTFAVENLARNKPTSQKTTNNNNVSGNAVDGDESTYSFTKNGQNWWQVDLESPSIITKIKILQRWPDKYGKRLWIDIQGSDGALLERIDRDVDDPPKRFEFDYDPPLVGQIVRISTKDNQYLSLSEVEVYGKLSPESDGPTKVPASPPTTVPTSSPTAVPTDDPTSSPVTSKPTFSPTNDQTSSPTPSSTAENIDVDWKFNENHDDVIVNVGETATFTWDSSNGFHNVYKHKIGSSGICNDKGTVLSNKSPFIYEFSEEDAGNDVWFSCQIGSHCSFGFKIKFTVQATSSAPTGDPTLAPSSPPTENLCNGKFKNKCKKIDFCQYDTNKRLKGCIPKKEHDCAQYDNGSTCKSAAKGVCVFDSDSSVCSHRCAWELKKSYCKKKKNKGTNIWKICKYRTMKNPCFKCHPKSCASS